MISTAEKLAEEHWNYIEQVLKTSGEIDEIIQKIKFHYVESFKHGYKHGRESYGKELNGENV